jgi:alpha-beta hydrolase superfamily lysophospholipase
MADSPIGLRLAPTYLDLANRFLELGYKKGEDLFGIPYGWRFGLHQRPDFWDAVMRLIENSVHTNGQRAVHVGHSMGDFFVHYFLSNITTPEWRSKYVESGILLAPSFGGSGTAFATLWMKALPLVKFIGPYPETINALGGLHIHMPNMEIFKDTVVYIDENGRERTGADITKILKDGKKLPGNASKFFEAFLPFFARPATTGRSGRAAV